MVIALLAALSVVVTPTAADAAGTVLFENGMHNSTVDGTGTVTVPTSSSGANQACLTAKGNTTTGPVLSCAGSADNAGGGKLRLTNASTNQVGGVFGATSFPTSNGLDVTFKSYQWGGGAADGLSMLLAAVDPANPAPPASMGPNGGSLGYSPAGSVRGLTNAYMGVGLDVFGNFSSTGFQGTGCTNVLNITSKTPGAAVVRGPGNGLVGYCGLSTTWTSSGKIALRAATRAASAVPVQVLINPTATSFTSNSGVSVDPGTYKVVVQPVNETVKTLSGPLPAAASTLYPSPSWLNANGVPKQLAFAFVASTGSVTDAHEIDDVKVLTFNPVPQLDVASTSYSAPTSTPGDPVTYRVSPRVLAGANETSPVSVTQTVPVGVVPVGAYGSGWVCAAPVGRSISCTTSTSAFAEGTTLPTVTVVGIVTGASVTDTFVRANSPSSVTSADANPATAPNALAGTLPTAPSGVSVNPAIGPVGGGTTVIGSITSGVAPTAVLIGTTAEQQAGTPVVLLPCTAGRAAGCFNIEDGSVAIASMPTRASAATVRVTTVTLGVAGFATYVYASSPAVPTTPTATAGINSARLAWAAPAANGSPITSYIVTPYLSGVEQPAQSFSASTTSTTFNGLAAGTSWTYTVAAVNAYGTSAPSTKSTAVVPYVLPGAPSITAASAGDASATLTWTTPSNGGNAITAYVVTPYLGAVAQEIQTFGTTTTRVVTGLTPGADYTFTVAATNAAGTGPASAKSSVVTPNFSASLGFPDPPAGEVGVPYSRQLTVSNGTSPFVWSVATGSLPAGLALNASTGVLSGTPTAAGSATVTIRVTDASGETATKSVTLVIAAAPSIAFTPAAGEVGVAYSQQPVLSGGTAPYTWAVGAGSLPAGLTLSSATGLISGTPTASGSFSVTIQVTDSFGKEASRTISLEIAAKPVFAAGSPAAGQVGVGYATTFTVNGGTDPLTWSIMAGSAPAGLTLNAANGTLSGTPDTTGTYTFTVEVTDRFDQTATKAVTVVIGAGPIVINKTADASSTTAGGTVSYTITVANTGTTARSITLQDPLSGVLDDAAYDQNATASTGTLSYASTTLSWEGTVAAGTTATISYSVTVAAAGTGAGNRTLSNTVTSSTLGTNCASGNSDARCASAVTVSGLTIVKSADVSSTTPGGVVRYQVVVTNTAPVPVTGATFTDNLTAVLDDARYAADATTTNGSVSFSGSSLTWTGTLTAGSSATITYSAVVRDPDTGDRSLASTVVSTSPGSSCPSGNPAASCTSTVPVLIPALVITNAAAVSTTTPGATVPYTVTLSNTGQTPYADASVSVALAAALDDATYDANAEASAGNVSASSGSLTWLGNLATGAVVTITYSVTVRSPDPGDRALTTVATSSAAGSTCSPGSPSSACTSTVGVLVPGMTISTSADASTTTPGSVVAYTVVATNTGQTPYGSATFATSLSAALDDATYNGDAAATAGSFEFASPNLSWTGALAVGATVTLTFSVTVRQPDVGNRSLTTTTSSTTAGSNCAVSSSNPACSTTVGVLVPALSFATTADTATTTPGGVVHYTFTVTNTGETTQQDVVVVVDLSAARDDATYNGDAVVSTGAQITNPEGRTSWTLTLAPGASATSTLSMTVNAPDTGDRVLRTLVSSGAPGSTCPASSEDPGCHTTVTVLVPGLTITKSADTATTTPGDSVGYTITVVNDGETPYAAATFSDDLTDILTDSAYSGDATATSGTISYSSRTLLWTGSLAPGATATISYSVNVSDPGIGDKHMTNTVVSTSRGNNCVAGSTDPRCLAAVHVNVPKLTLVTTADSPTTAPGKTVDFSVTVTNTGATAYLGARFDQSLANVLDDAAYVPGSASATTGTASYAASTLTWTGDLAIGASATVTYSALVHTSDGGNNLLTDVTTSSTTGNNCLIGGDARCTATVPVARLVLAYGHTSPTVAPGGIIHFSATYTNTGRVPYTGISVAALGEGAADDGLPGGDQTASSGVLTVGATGAVWTGDIPVGGEVTLSATMGVQDPDLGDGVVFVTMESSAPGNNCPPGSVDPRCSLTVRVLTPGLTILKTASALTAAPGDTVGYTLTMTNTGQSTYTDAVVTDALAGVLDDATYDANATTDVGVLSYSASTLTWTGSLLPGDRATATYSVTVNNPGTGDKDMTGPVSSTAKGSSCPPASGTPQCRTSVSVLTPALTIAASASRTNATLGTVISHTVTATNTGQTTYSAAAFTSDLGGVLDDATYGNDATATIGGVVYQSGTLQWSGMLGPGDSVTVRYTVRINNPGTGDGALVTAVTSTTDGNNCPAASADPRCSVTVAVTDSTSLTLEKTAGVETTEAGEVVHYTITVTNLDSVVVAGASLIDPLTGILDDADLVADAQADMGNVNVDASALTWSGDLAPGSTATITYSVTVHSIVVGNQVLDGTIRSTTLPTSNNCVDGSADPRCSSTVPVAALRIQQTAGSPTATPGSTVVVSQTFTNTGKVPYTGISIVSPRGDTSDDTIPLGDQVVSSGTLVRTPTAVVWTGDIPVGGAVTSTRTLTVRNPDPGNKIITAKLSSTAPGNNCPAGSLDPTCVFRVDVLVAGLTIVKTSDTPATQPGGRVGYTVTVNNTGATTYTAATVTDSLAGVLDDATYGSDAVTSRGTVSYTSGTLTWTGDLGPGDEAIITYTVTARSSATGDKTMVSAVSSTDVGSTCPPSSGSSSCNSLVVVLTPSLIITTSVNKITTQPGATVTSTVVATNNGQTYHPSAGFEMPLAGVLDDADLSGSASADRGTATLAGSTLVWAGALAPGETVTVTFAVVVKAVPTGDFRLRQTVVSTTAGSNCLSSGTEPGCSNSVPIASLRIVNSADVTTALPTGVVRNTVTLTNIGQVPYVDTVVNDSFVGSLDDATYNGDAAATSGVLLLVTGSGQVRWTGNLAPGESATITGSLTVNNPPTGNKNLGTRVTTDAVASNCPVVGGGAECATSVPVEIPELTITKTADKNAAGPGDTVAYTIVAENTGETDYLDATFSDPLANLLTDADFNNDAETTAGSIEHASDVLTWRGDLAVGASVTVTFTVQVQSPYGGDGTMANQAVSDELGSTCPTVGGSPGCHSAVTVLVPGLGIAVTADRSTTVPGGLVGYTVTVHNKGQTNYVNATATVLLGGVLDDGSYNEDAVTDVGAVVETGPDLAWAGDLLIGETATITYSIRVADSGDGDFILFTSATSAAPGGSCDAASACVNSVTVLVPGLTVTTSPDVTTATPGDQVTFSTVVTNTGQTPYAGAVVTSDLSDVLDDATFDGNVIATSGVAVYTTPTVRWTGSLLPGATATIRYTVTARSPGPGNKRISAGVVAEDQGSTCPPGSIAPVCKATVDLLIPELSISKSTGSPTSTPGSVVGYSITVTNTGETPYAAAAIDDSLSGVLTDSSYNDDAEVIGGGVLNYADSTLSWTGALPVSATATITYSITVDDPDTGDKHLVNTVTSSSPGSNCLPASPDPKCTATVDVLVPALDIDKQADTTTVVAGSALQYTITVRNSGQTTYGPAVVTDSLAGVLDDASYNDDAEADRGTVDDSSETTIVWTASLDPGQTATLTYSVTVDFPSTGDRFLVNTALSNSPGSNCATGADARCTSTVPVVIPALAITKTTDVTQVVAGGVVSYTITVANTGDAAYPAAAFVDSMSDVLDDASYNDDASASTGALDYADGMLTWSGSLPIDATATISYSATTDVAASEGALLINSLVSTSVGSSCPAGGSALACSTTTPIAARSIELSGLDPSFTLAGPPHTTVSNEGAVTMTVTTNVVAGYSVSVLGASESLVGSRPDNTDVIPLARLELRETGTADYLGLSTTSSTSAHAQPTASGAGGDAVSNDYRMHMPNVLPDTYSTTLNYVVAAN